MRGCSDQRDVMLAQDRLVKRQDKTESPEINPYIHGQLVFDVGVKTMQWRKNSLFNKWCWDNWISIHIPEVGTLFHTTKMNPIQIIDLDVRGKTMKLVKADTEIYLCLGLGKDFLE